MPGRGARARRARARDRREWMSLLVRLFLMPGQFLLSAPLALAEVGVEVTAVPLVRPFRMLASADFVEVGIDVDVLAHTVEKVRTACRWRRGYWVAGLLGC